MARRAFRADRVPQLALVRDDVVRALEVLRGLVVAVPQRGLVRVEHPCQ